MLAMNMSNSSSLVDFLAHPTHNLVPEKAQYAILLIITPLATLCNLFVLYHLLFDPVLRKQLHNHVIIAILFASLEFNLIHVPFSVNLFITGSVWPRSIIACSIWRFTAYLGCNANDVLLAWAAIERHILIYHSNALRQYRYRLLLHYIPLIAIVLYLFFFNAASFFTPACFSHYDYTAVFCDATCLGSVVFMSTWYLAVNQLFAALIAIVFSFALLFRVIQRRIYWKKPLDWHRLNKLTIQVLVLTALFIVLELPYAISGTLDYFGLFRQSYTFKLINAINLFLCYIMPIIMPFACFLGLYEDLRGKLCQPVRKLFKSNRISTTMATLK